MPRARPIYMRLCARGETAAYAFDKSDVIEIWD